MNKDPQEPIVPEPPGEPNSTVEPEKPDEVRAEIPEETPGEAEETGDYISEIRETLVSEETTQPKGRTGRLIQRITGTLRRVTGPLHHTDRLKGEKSAAAPELSEQETAQKPSTGRLENEPDQEISDELLTGRLDSAQLHAMDHQPSDYKSPTGRLGSEPEPETSSDLLTGRLDSGPSPEGRDLLTGRLGRAEPPETGNLLTGRLGSAAPDAGDLLTGRPGSIPSQESEELLTGRLDSEAAKENPGDLLTGRLRSEPPQEASEDLLTGKESVAPEQELPDKLLTGRLGIQPEEETDEDLLTGRLGAEPKQEAYGDMLTGRLGAETEQESSGNLLTGRLGAEPKQEPSDDLLTGRLGTEPEEEPSDNLLTGRLGAETKQEPSDDLLTGRLATEPKQELSDNLLTGRLGAEPEDGISDSLLTGRLGAELEEQTPENLLTSRLDVGTEEGISDNLLTGRLGVEPAQERQTELLSGKLDQEETTPEITDDMISGRLGGEPVEEISEDFLTRRLDNEPAPEIADDVEKGKLSSAPGEEITTSLLMDRLGEEAPPETPGNLMTARLAPQETGPISEDFLSGKLDAEPEPEISDDFLSGRLGSEPKDELPIVPSPLKWSDLVDSGIEAAELLEMEEEPLPNQEVVPGPLPEEDAPISLIESGAIAAMGMAEEEAALGEAEDWMREIRESAEQEAAQTSETAAPPEPPAGEQPPVPGRTSTLRNFITGILRRSEEKPDEPDENLFPDELVSGRLERSLGAAAQGTLANEPSEAEIEPAANALEEPFPGTLQEITIHEEPSALEPPAVQEKDDFFEGLEVNFSNVAPAEAGEENQGYELYPEDEALLWGEAGQAATEPAPPDIPISPEEVWGSDTNNLGYGSDLRREIWQDAEEPETPIPGLFEPSKIPPPQTKDLYAAQYLTGMDFLPSMEGEQKSEEEEEEDLLKQVLGETPGTEDKSSVQDLRAIALENYEEGEFNYADYTYKIDWDEEGQAASSEAELWTGQNEQAAILAEEADAETRKALSTDWKSWFVNRRTGQKILIVEAAIVILAMVIGVPYFVFMILRGPATAPAVQVQPDSVPADVPYPTGLTLPGGWYFPLERSALTNGKWQPSTSEWLQGTEVRRVVALPWNPQTEAVIKTFQVGDWVELYLSNNDSLKYRVASIEQLAVSDTSIYYDQSPSLAIILYQGKDPNRWVIICKP